MLEEYVVTLLCVFNSIEDVERLISEARLRVKVLQSVHVVRREIA